MKGPIRALLLNFDQKKDQLMQSNVRSHILPTNDLDVWIIFGIDLDYLDSLIIQ